MEPHKRDKPGVPLIPCASLNEEEIIFALVLTIISEKSAQVPFRYHSTVHSVDKLSTVILDQYLIFLFRINK